MTASTARPVLVLTRKPEASRPWRARKTRIFQAKKVAGRGPVNSGKRSAMLRSINGLPRAPRLPVAPRVTYRLGPAASTSAPSTVHPRDGKSSRRLKQFQEIEQENAERASLVRAARSWK